jgi:hypothetical protein
MAWSLWLTDQMKGGDSGDSKNDQRIELHWCRRVAKLVRRNASSTSAWSRDNN